MRLGYTCRHCRSLNEVSLNATDRSQIRDGHPNGLSLICGTCHKENNIEPNDMKARESKYIGLIFILVFIPAIVLGYYLFTGFSERSSFYLKSVAIFFSLAIPAAIYFTAVRAEQKRVRDFNKYKI